MDEHVAAISEIPGPLAPIRFQSSLDSQTTQYIPIWVNRQMLTLFNFREKSELQSEHHLHTNVIPERRD